MSLKELFEKAEGGVLTYDQFVAAYKEAGMKLADLSTGDYVAKKKFDDEMASKDSQISTLNETIAQRDTDLDGLKIKLSEAGNDIEKLNKLSSDLTSLQSKYDSDVQAYKAQLAKQAYEFAVKDFASTKTFTSKAAKRDFINSMIAKDLKMDGDKILGADDFVNAYSADNEDAFFVEVDPEPEDNSSKQSLPQFIDSTPGNDGGSSEGFHFNFTGVRAHD